MGLGWWGHYKAGSVGRILHFLYQYCGLGVAEKSVVGGDQVRFGDKLYARVTWKDIEVEGVKLNIPVFDFVDPHKNVVQEQCQRAAVFCLEEFRDKVRNGSIQ